MITKKCLICEKEFQTIPNRIRKGNGKYCSRKCYYASKKLFFNGRNNPKWKGNKVGIKALHIWVVRKKGRPKICEHCGKKGKKIKKQWDLDWANKNHTYKRNLDDYIGLCPLCHRRHDIANGILKGSYT